MNIYIKSGKKITASEKAFKVLYERQGYKPLSEKKNKKEITEEVEKEITKEITEEVE